MKLENWIRTRLLRAMVFGDSSLQIQGIAQTQFFLFVISTQGLSELGITIADASKLLKAYQDSFRVSVRGSRLEFKFGDHAKLISATPHPFAGTGNLQIKSWMEWVISTSGGPPKKVRGRGFVPRAALDPNAGKQIRVTPGGLMLPRGVAGSKGAWQFPPKLQNYQEKWLRRNAVPIKEAIEDKISELIALELK